MSIPVERLPDRRVPTHDRDGNSSVETLGKLFVPGGLWGWYCCAGSDCVLHTRLETIQLGDNSAECAVYIVLLVSERRAFTTLGRQ